MKQAEVAHYRAMLQAQAIEPAKRGFFRPRSKVLANAPTNLSSVGAATILGGGGPAPLPPSGPPPRRAHSLFGRRPPEPVSEAAEPLILDLPVEPATRLRLRAWTDHHHLAETPYHAEDLADPPPANGPTPGVIAGWSNAKPPSAQTRLLRRLGAVIDAERHGLAARLAAAGIEAAA